jgi:hypothetical protein
MLDQWKSISREHDKLGEILLDEIQKRERLIACQIARENTLASFGGIIPFGTLVLVKDSLESEDLNGDTCLGQSVDE